MDAIQGANTLWTTTVDLHQGDATLTFDPPSDVHGEVRFRATHADANGELLIAERVVTINPRTALDIATSFDREDYRPGETAKVSAVVTRDGRPTVAAVSLAGVDESVFALRSARPDAAAAGRPPIHVVPLQGDESYRARAARVERQRSRWLRWIGGLAMAVPLFACWFLLVIIAWRARSAARIEPTAPRPPLEREMRGVVVAWFGALVLPSVSAGFGGAALGPNVAIFYGLVAAGVATFVLHHAAVRARMHLATGPLERALRVLWLAVVLCTIGVIGVLIAVAERLVDDSAIALLVITWIAWAIAMAYLSAAGRTAATGSRRLNALYFWSRLSFAIIPVCIAAFLTTRSAELKQAAVGDDGIAEPDTTAKPTSGKKRADTDSSGRSGAIFLKR